MLLEMMGIVVFTSLLASHFSLSSDEIRRLNFKRGVR